MHRMEGGGGQRKGRIQGSTLERPAKAGSKSFKYQLGLNMRLGRTGVSNLIGVREPWQAVVVLLLGAIEKSCFAVEVAGNHQAIVDLRRPDFSSRTLSKPRLCPSCLDTVKKTTIDERPAGVLSHCC